ncbi:MAG: DoxX family protein [Acidobacteria bacterium]|nr:DoxX family protein [Acidobacteriota bacterium]
MAVTYWIIFLPRGGWPLRNGGETSLQFLIIFLVLFTSGPGKIAVDQLFSHTSRLYGSLDRFSPVTLALLRIVTGILFWQHGAAKWGLLGGRVVPFPELRFFARILEFFGGPLISLGLFVRPLAFVLSGEMAFAFFIGHFPRGFWPIQKGGEPADLNGFIYLFLVTAGPGRWSLDGLLSRKRKTS